MIDKLVRLMIILTVFLSSCKTTKTNTVIPPVGSNKIVKSIIRSCESSEEDLSVVVCKRDGLLKASLDIINLEKHLELSVLENERLERLGAVDIMELENKNIELQNKLDSPWRSWWLWTLVGATIATSVSIVK